MINAVHLLLDHLRHGVFQRFRRSTRIGDVDRDGGRGDGGVLRNGEGTNCERTRDHEDDGDHPGEDRAIDEEFRHNEVLYLAS